jgi:hypothetical protein
MSIFTSIFNIVAGIVAPSAAPTTSAAATTLFDIGKLPITVGELTAGVRTAENFPFADIEKAIGDHLSNFQDDALVAEDFAKALAAINVPFAADADLAIMAIAWIVAHGDAASSTAYPSLQPPPNGGLVGAFLDSLRGVVRPVANPSGAIGG